MDTSGSDKLPAQELALVMAVEYVSRSDYLRRDTNTALIVARSFRNFLEGE